MKTVLDIIKSAEETAHATLDTPSGFTFEQLLIEAFKDAQHLEADWGLWRKTVTDRRNAYTDAKATPAPSTPVQSPATNA